MKKNITTFCLIGSLLIILDSVGMWRMMTEFFFIGLIPGTDVRLAPSLMLMLFSIVAGLILGNTFMLPLMRKQNLVKG